MFRIRGHDSWRQRTDKKCVSIRIFCVGRYPRDSRDGWTGHDDRFRPDGRSAPLLLQFILARAGYRVDWCIHGRLLGSISMSVEIEARDTDRAPGSHRSSRDRLRSYLVGLALAMVLTAASF